MAFLRRRARDVEEHANHGSCGTVPCGWIPVPVEADGNRIPTLRVAGQSDPKNMATAIERRVLDYRAVKLEAVGANSVNQAAKGIAIARSNLKNIGHSCAAKVEFIHIPAREAGQPERSALQFLVFGCPPIQWLEGDREFYGRGQGSDEGARILRVSRSNDPKSIANTIANRMKRDLQMRIQAVGPGSVNVVMKSIAIATRTLEDTICMEVAGSAEFVHVPAPDPKEREHTALRWTLMPTSERFVHRSEERRDSANDYDVEEGRNIDSAEWDRPVARRMRPMSAQDLDPPPYQPESNVNKVAIQELKVAASSDPKAIAGAVAVRLRSKEPVRVTVMGPSSVNQATKALAVLRNSLLTDGRDFAAYANFTHVSVADNGPERSAIQLTVLPCRPQAEDADVTEYKVAGTTNPKSTGGAISNCVRSGGSCKLEALGRDAVNQAIKAIAIGRTNLLGDKIDIGFLPKFRSLQLSDGRRSALELTILPIRGQ